MRLVLLVLPVLGLPGAFASPARAEEKTADLKRDARFRRALQEADLVVTGTLVKTTDDTHPVAAGDFILGRAGELHVVTGPQAKRVRRERFAGEDLDLFGGDLPPAATGVWVLRTSEKTGAGRTLALVLDFRPAAAAGDAKAVLADQEKIREAVKRDPLIVLGTVREGGAVDLSKVLKTAQHLESLSVRQAEKMAGRMAGRLYRGPLPLDREAILFVQPVSETQDGQRRIGFATAVEDAFKREEIEREIARFERDDVDTCAKRSRVIVVAALDLEKVKGRRSHPAAVGFEPRQVLKSRGKIYFPTVYWWPETNRFLSRIPESGEGIWFLRSTFADRNHMKRGFVVVGFQPLSELERVKEIIADPRNR
jgi:hypothetical protein